MFWGYQLTPIDADALFTERTRGGGPVTGTAPGY